jgi:hypothetical protein
MQVKPELRRTKHIRQSASSPGRTVETSSVNGSNGEAASRDACGRFRNHRGNNGLSPDNFLISGLSCQQPNIDYGKYANTIEYKQLIYEEKLCWQKLFRRRSSE